MMRSPTIPPLRSGGIITNYNCPSACAHCLYASSPNRKSDYILIDRVLEIAAELKHRGIRSIHIGGGEPFLRLASLTEVIKSCIGEGILIQYVETNCAWFTSPEKAISILEALKKAGLSTLLISISPFHNSYIPFGKTQGVMEACRVTGMEVFPWVSGFTPDLRSFDPGQTHSLDEYREKFGSHYLREIPERYWITPRGRALYFLRPFLKESPAEEIISSHHGPCGELYDTSHFHVDLYGNYIPGLCSGFSVPIEALGQEVDPDRFPWIYAGMTEGIRGITELAYDKMGYRLKKDRYVSKCEICQEVRGAAVFDGGHQSPDLAPAGFYREIGTFVE